MASPTAVASSGAGDVRSAAVNNIPVTPGVTPTDDNVMYIALDRAAQSTLVTIAGGWTSIGKQNYGGGSVEVFRKIASGESGAYTATWQGTSRCCITYIEVNGAPTVDPEEVVVAATDTTGNPNPPASGTVPLGDYLALVVGGVEGKVELNDPTGYTQEAANSQVTVGGGNPATHCALNLAWQELTGITSEDPGLFGNASGEWGTFTILVKEATGTIARTVTDPLGLTDTPSRDVSAVRTVTDPLGLTDDASQGAAYPYEWPSTNVYAEWGGSFVGPIQDGNGNLYCVVENSAGLPDAELWKSTDDGKTFTMVASRSNVLRDLEAAWIVDIPGRTGEWMLLIQRSSGSDVRTQRFGTSDHATFADDFDAVGNVYAFNGVSGANPDEGDLGNTISAARWNGNQLAACFEVGVTTTDGIKGNTWIPGTNLWGTPFDIAVDSPNVDYTGGHCVSGTSSGAWFVYKDHTNNDIYARSYSSGGALGSPVQVNTNGVTVKNAISSPVAGAVFHTDGATEVITVVWLDNSDKLWANEIRGGAASATPIQVSTRSVLSDYITAATTESAAAFVVGDPNTDTVYVLFADLTNRDIYVADSVDGAAFSTETLVISGLDTNAISASMISISGSDYLGIMYVSGTTGPPTPIFFDVYQLGAAPILRAIVDALGITDTASRTSTAARTLTDPENPTDVVTRVVDAIRASTDNLDLTDVTTRAAAYAYTLTSSEGLTDTATQVSALIRAITDAEGVTDNTTQVAALARILIDPSGLTDATQQAAVFALVVADSLGLTDDATYTLQAIIARSIADGLSLADTTVTVADFARALTDAEGLTDTEAVTAAFTRIVTDPGGLTDTVVQAVTAVRTITGGMGLTDTMSQLLLTLIARTITDQLDATDQAVKVSAAVRAVTDATGLTDTVLQATDFIRSQADAAGLTDAATYQLIALIARTITDAAGLTDTAAAIAAYQQTVADTTGLTDTLAQTLAATRVAVDAVNLTDATSTAATTTRAVTDALGFTDDVSYSLLGIIVRTIADLMGFTDTNAQAATTFRQATDPAGLADTTTRNVDATRLQADSLAFTDIAAAARTISATLTDGLAATDTVTRAAAYAQTLIDMVDLVDQAATTSTFVQELIDAEGLTDTVLKFLLGPDTDDILWKIGPPGVRWIIDKVEERWAIEGLKIT